MMAKGVDRSSLEELAALLKKGLTMSPLVLSGPLRMSRSTSSWRISPQSLIVVFERTPTIGRRLSRENGCCQKLQHNPDGDFKESEIWPSAADDGAFGS